MNETFQIHNYGKVPEGRGYYGDIAALNEWDIERLQPLGIDEAWYWYVDGGYDGSGQLLMRKGEEYDIHDMGHCSCYGPTEDAQFKGTYQSLDQIKEKCSEEAYKEVAPLVEMARARLKDVS